MKVEIEFTEPALGTLAGNKEIATEHILSKATTEDGAPPPDEVEVVENMDEALEKGSTVFPRDENGQPFIWDYQWKGYFKEACLTMIETDTMTQETLKKLKLTRYMYKRSIDKLIHVTPRQIVLELPLGCDPANLDDKERPLRGQTMRGERICLARSEIIPVGTKCTFEINCWNNKHPEYVREWLNMGKVLGTLQWRSGGWGRFIWRLVNGEGRVR